MSCYRDVVLDVAEYDPCDFQLGGARGRMTWSERLIPDKGDLRDYWVEISSDRDFPGPAPSYIFIRDPVRRLCHRMISCSISDRGQAPKKGLRGLSVVTRELSMIDLHELYRLNICERFGDMWAWVALTPMRQLDAAPGAPEDAPAVDEGAQADQLPLQAPKPTLAAPRTMM
ncbi:hypothetical protein Tco_0485401 [Tanacetum coccineum]